MSSLQSIQIVGSIILMILIGYGIAKHWSLQEDVANLLSKIVLSIAVPGYMISSLTTRFNRNQLMEIFNNIYIPLFITLFVFCIGILLAKVIGLSRNQRGAFVVTASISNTIFVGLPVNTGLFGDESLPYVFICFMVNVILFWTIGAGIIARDGKVSKGQNRFLSTMKQIFTPPMIAFILSLGLVWYGVKLPDILLIPCRHMGSMMTPLSMLYLGVVLSQTNIFKLKWDKSMVILLLVRYVMTPLLVFTTVTLAGLPILMQKVFLIQAVMPAMSITSVISKKVGGNFQYAAMITTITTVATLLVLPLYIHLISLLLP